MLWRHEKVGHYVFIALIVKHQVADSVTYVRTCQCTWLYTYLFILLYVHIYTNHFDSGL